MGSKYQDSQIFGCHRGMAVTPKGVLAGDVHPFGVEFGTLASSFLTSTNKTDGQDGVQQGSRLLLVTNFGAKLYLQGGMNNIGAHS